MSHITHKLKKLHADTLTPTSIYMKLTGTRKFLLESSSHHHKNGKFSFIGASPYQEIIGKRDETTIHDKERKQIARLPKPALTVIKDYLPKLDLDLPFPFAGGAVGYIGYDVIHSYEQIGAVLPDELDMPDVHLLLYHDLIVYSHQEKCMYLLTVNIDQATEATLNKRLFNLEKSLTNPAPAVKPVQPIKFQQKISKKQFTKNVATIKHHITEGDVFQTVLSQRMQGEMTGDPFSFYQKLRKQNPSPYMFYLDFDDYIILGTSPESLVQTCGRQITANPIAGTRPRGKTADEDKQFMNDLYHDEKEIAEHRMLVDLSRNDLSRICKPNSIHIPTYMQIETYQHVMHMVSEVHGYLRDDTSSMDAIRVCLPAGTVSGAPKIRAMQLINELEIDKRGVYGGGIGFIDFNHDLNMALAIRTLIIQDGQATLQAGAGIVADSVPENEYQETLYKMQSLTEVNHNVPINR